MHVLLPFMTFNVGSKSKRLVQIYESLYFRRKPKESGASPVFKGHDADNMLGMSCQVNKIHCTEIKL